MSAGDAHTFSTVVSPSTILANPFRSIVPMPAVTAARRIVTASVRASVSARNWSFISSDGVARMRARRHAVSCADGVPAHAPTAGHSRGSHSEEDPCAHLRAHTESAHRTSPRRTAIRVSGLFTVDYGSGRGGMKLAPLVGVRVPVQGLSGEGPQTNAFHDAHGADGAAHDDAAR